jgi:spermidine/putrescine transport system permease protein
MNRVLIWYGELTTQRRLTKQGLQFLGIGMLWILLFLVLPGLVLVVVSFATRGSYGQLEWTFTIENYKRLLGFSVFGWTADYIIILWRSVWVAFVTSLIAVILSYPLCFFICSRPERTRYLWLMLVIIPFWTNSLIRSYALVFILKTNGLLNQVLMASGLIDHPIRMLYSDTAVLIGLVYTLMPFMILPIYASVEKLDPRLIEAAHDLGAGKIRTFLHVALPLTMPGIVAGITLVFLPALGMFYIPDILGGAKSLLIGNFIKNQFMTARNWPAGAAAGILLTLIMIVLIAVYQRSVARAQKAITVAI